MTAEPPKPDLNDIIMAAAAQQAVPNLVPPQPVPMVITTDQVQAPDGQILVQLSISHPSGLSIFFFDQKLARAVGNDLREKGVGGLLVARPDTKAA